MANSTLSLRPAHPDDAQKIMACVTAAYQHYIPRIGKPPGPMLDDYANMIEAHSIWIVEHEGLIAGLVVLMEKPDGLLLDNVAVHPDFQGQGLGKRLTAFAEKEAQHRGFTEIYLYTHEKMNENFAIYQKLGYIETERRTERGFQRIYMRKSLVGE